MSNDDETLPVGIYVPPLYSSSDRVEVGSTDGCDASPEKHQQDGYVRIANAKGKNFPCGFSRPVGTLMETIIEVTRKKRRYSLISNNTQECTEIHDNIDNHKDAAADSELKPNGIIQQKRTITEERLHPEEALFLHMRGLLRIECSNLKTCANGDTTLSTMSTKDLFCKMLPECKISFAAYLAYAHLRAQGYILIRYSTERIKLILARSVYSKPTVLHQCGDKPNHSSEVTDFITKTATQKRPNITERQLKQQLSHDIATSLPPCVVSFDQWSSNRPKDLNTSIAYFAYNPNSNFKRSNPGLPDFGVAVMPFHSSGVNAPTFDTVSALVALCGGEGHDRDQKNDDADVGSSNEIPLRIATVADGGAVIVYGVTRGDVPVIDKKKKGSYNCDITNFLS